jgi:hypothetical protein
MSGNWLIDDWMLGIEMWFLGVTTCNQRIFRPELNATDGRSSRHYLQLNLQSITSTSNHPPQTGIICN